MKWYILVVLFFAIGFANAQRYTINGLVNNSAGESVAYVNVSILDMPSMGTSTNLKGEYTFQLEEGSYTLVYNITGYKTLKYPIIVSKNATLSPVIIEQDETEFVGVKVSLKKVDRSEEIIKQVIANKLKYLYTTSYSNEAYIKATLVNQVVPNKKDTLDSLSMPDITMAEIHLKTFFSSPNKIKEERKAVVLRGNTQDLFYLSHTEGDFNFYKNLIQVPALSESPLLSPISNSGLIAYKYKWMGVFYENDIKYYKIKVSPGLLGNALFSGELVIQDSTWSIKSLSLVAPKYHTPEYDFFEVNQTYGFELGKYHLMRQEFNYQTGSKKNHTNGKTIVVYSNFEDSVVLNKRFFNNELSSTAQEAYEKDSLYWQGIRKEPYSPLEIAFIRKSDSLVALKSQKFWQDSVDAVYNKITMKKLFLFGQGNYNRSNERTWSFKPLVFLYQPLYIAGPRVDYWVGYNKESKNKKEFNAFVRANMGTINKDLKGSVSLSRLYNPFKRASYSMSFGSDFGIINPFESWIRLFSRANFYVHDFASFSHRKEIINGLYVGLGTEFSNRRSVSNLTFDSRGDSLWGGNTDIIDFSFYQALYFSTYISYVPFQKYVREPYQKLILGSVWPELSIRYRKGVPVFGSVVDFDYLEFGIEHDLKVGLLGNTKYRFVSGEFLQSRDLRIVDYKFQRRAGPVFFTNPLFSFQGIDSTYNTLQRFYEFHYLHRFNGALINKVPLLKKLNIIEVAGAGFLYTKERNFKYVEAFVGIEKVIRFWNERFKLGVFLVAAQSNLYSYRPQLKFTIEAYDKVRNKWPY